jgi:hypothetical protein
MHRVIGLCKTRGWIEILTMPKFFEPPRVLRRLFGLSHAAMAGCSSMA